MYPIVQSPSDVLRTATKPVDFGVDKLHKIIEEMKTTMLACKDPEGIGLAANQVNLPYNLFVARFGTKKSDPVLTFVNPEIIGHSDELQDIESKKAQLEGCLSVPKYYGTVKRFQWVQLKYQNEKLEMKNEKFENFPAIVIQHEMDHLTGHIFVERILEQKGRLYKITGKDKKGKEMWEEIKL